MKKMSLAILGLSILTVTTSAFADSSTFQCFNNGYRNDMFAVTDFNVELSENYPVGSDQVARIAAESLGLEGRFTVQSTSLLLDKSELCTVGPLKFSASCKADEARAVILVKGYRTTVDNVSASVTAALHVKVKDLKLVSIISSRGPTPIVDQNTVILLNQLRVTAQALVEINGQSIPMSWDTNYETGGKSDGTAFTYCEVTKK